MPVHEKEEDEDNVKTGEAFGSTRANARFTGTLRYQIPPGMLTMKFHLTISAPVTAVG